MNHSTSSSVRYRYALDLATGRLKIIRYSRPQDCGKDKAGRFEKGNICARPSEARGAQLSAERTRIVVGKARAKTLKRINEAVYGKPEPGKPRTINLRPKSAIDRAVGDRAFQAIRARDWAAKVREDGGEDLEVRHQKILEADRKAKAQSEMLARAKAAAAKAKFTEGSVSNEPEVNPVSTINPEDVRNTYARFGISGSESRGHPNNVLRDRAQSYERSISSYKSYLQGMQTETGRPRKGAKVEEIESARRSIEADQLKLKELLPIMDRFGIHYTQPGPSTFAPPRTRREVLNAQALNRSGHGVIGHNVASRAADLRVSSLTDKPTVAKPAISQDQAYTEELTRRLHLGEPYGPASEAAKTFSLRFAPTGDQGKILAARAKAEAENPTPKPIPRALREPASQPPPVTRHPLLAEPLPDPAPRGASPSEIIANIGRLEEEGRKAFLAKFESNGSNTFALQSRADEIHKLIRAEKKRLPSR